MPKRTNPADVANLFIRCFLSDVGEALGGCSNQQWRKTLEYFDFCCAYTGKPVTEATAVMDHAIPMNKRHCGLHLFGNLVPCTSAANAEKHHRHYRELLSSPERIQRIEEWLRRTQYFQRVEAIANLHEVCSEKYAFILEQCRAGREFAFQQFGTAINREPTAVRRPRLARVRPNVLPIELVSIADGDFKEELLRTRRAWITVEYCGGEVNCTVWRIERLTPESNILRNLRSRPRFRAGEWQKRGIVRVTVTLVPPG